MNFDVFISYAHQDKAAADAACAKIEAEGIRCWIAPRDVPPGAEWAGAIINAIDNCRVMVLIFSSSSNGSRQIDREAQRAFDKEKSVIPFRIEDVTPQNSLAYYLGPVHWLDALTEPLDQHLQKLSISVKALVQADKPSDDKEPLILQKTVTRQEAEAKALTEEQERQRLESEAAASREAEERGRQAAAAEIQRRERAAAAERIRREEEAKRNAEQEQAFAKAEDADTAAAFSSFISNYPESHLAGDAQKEKARLLARDEPPPNEPGAETVPRTTAPAPSIRTFLQIVRGLLILQGIGRVGFAIYVSTLTARYFDYRAQFEAFSFMEFVWILWGLVTIGIALRAYWQKKWARVCGLIMCAIMFLHDAVFALVGSDYGYDWAHILLVLSLLFLVVDVVTFIYLLKNRTLLRTA